MTTITNASRRRMPRADWIWTRGLRAFVVGSGGAGLYKLRRIHPNSEAFQAEEWGILELRLSADRYAWRFVAADGGSARDQGAAPCNARRAPG